MDPRKTAKSSGTKSGEQMSKLTAGVKDLSVKQFSKPKEAKKDPKYDAGRLLLKKLEGYGMFKNLPKPALIHTMPKVIDTESCKKGTVAPRVGVPTTIKPGSRSAPLAPAEKKTATQAPSKSAPKAPTANQKAGTKDLKPAKISK